MIENIRKYTGLMIVVLVLLFIGLVFLGDTARSSVSGKPVMEVAGTGISQKEFQRLAANALQIPGSIGRRPPLTKEARLLASHYIGETVIDATDETPSNLLINMMTLLGGDYPSNFLANRLAVRKAGLELGATPGPEEVEAFIENILFADAEGKFDTAGYSEFIEKKIGRLGIGSSGFNEFVRDLLTAQNLASLLGGGIVPDSSSVKTFHDIEKQTIVAEQISLTAAEYELTIKPTDEEIKAYYEENKENYNSDERRKISYVLIEPNWEETLKTVTEEKAVAKAKAEEAKKKAEEDRKKAEAAAKAANDAKKPAEEKAEDLPEPAEEPAAPEETPAPTPATEEEGAQGEIGAQGEPAPAAPETSETPETPATPAVSETPATITAPPIAITPGTTEVTKEVTVGKPTPPKPVLKPKTAKEQLSPQEMQKAVKALSNDVDDLYQTLLDEIFSKDFATLVAENKNNYDVRTADFFAKDEPPKALDKTVTGNSAGKLPEAIFKVAPNADADQLFTPPLGTNDGWYILHLDEVLESKPLSFEDAKVRATVDLKKKLAREMLIEKAKEFREQIAKDVKEGKTFEEAAKAADEKKKVAKLPKLAKPDNSRLPARFRAQYGQKAPPAFDVAKYTNSGELAEIKFTPDEDNAEKALIVFVSKREVVNGPGYSKSLGNREANELNNARIVAFQNWLSDQYNANDVQTFFEENN